jgi:hypothetical protein
MLKNQQQRREKKNMIADKRVPAIVQNRIKKFCLFHCRVWLESRIELVLSK